MLNEVLRYLGYKNQQVDENVLIQINKNIEFCNEKIRPAFMYRIFDVCAGEYINLEDTNVSFVGKDIYNHLKDASKCAVMAATLGYESERILNKLSKTNVSDAIIFDAVCTAKIEEVCDECEEQIKNLAKKSGYYTNFRYSPGYGDFPLETQNKITAILGCGKALGLSVTENSLLIPRKSVTAVIGIFCEQQIGNKKNCSSCNLVKNCKFRKNDCSCRKEDE